MSGTVARSLGNLADKLGNTATANVSFDSGLLFIDGVNNRVGVGTTAPGYPLTINRAGSTDSYAQWTNGGGGNFIIGAVSNGDALLYNAVNTAMLFATNSTERMRISANGNVGIGTTSPSDIFHVRGVVGGGGQTLALFSGNSTFNGIGLQSTQANSSTNSNIFFDALNENRIAVGNMAMAILTDGSSIWSWSTTPAGSRSSDRRVERVRITGSGVLETYGGSGGVAIDVRNGGDIRINNGDNTTNATIWSDASAIISTERLRLHTLRTQLDRAWDNYPSISVENDSGPGPFSEFRIHGINGASGGDFSVVTRCDGGFITGSDSRRKTDVEPIPNALSTVLAMQGKSFSVVNKGGDIDTNVSHSGKKIGFIGQELIQLLPEAVKYYPEVDTPTESGWASAYSVDYASITALLVEAIKELTTKLTTAEATIAELKSKIEER